MKASQVVEPKKSEVVEVRLPNLDPMDVLIRVEACGVCSSELHRWSGTAFADDPAAVNPYPIRLGHEPSGVIERVGIGVHGWKEGQRVAALAPGKGAYAQYIAVSQDRLIELSADMSFSAASMAEPVGCLVSGLERTPLTGLDKVAIVGCGFMGLALLQMIKSQGVAEIIAIDVRQEAREIAMRMGATQAFSPEEVRAENKVVQWSQIGQGVDAVFETTGAQPALTLAGEMTKVHGTLSIVGWHWDGVRSVNIGLWNWKAITVINAHERRMDHLVDCMKKGLMMIQDGAIFPSTLLTHTFPLAGIDDAFQAMLAKPPGFIKAVILPQG